MKKILIIGLLLCMSSFFIFADSPSSNETTNVQIQTTVPTTEVTFGLYYEEETTAIIEDRIFEVGYNTLTDSTLTTTLGLFKVKATSNSNNDLTVTINVDPGEFVAPKNGNGQGQGNLLYSGITPNVIDLYNVGTLVTGYYEDEVVCSFNLQWSGSDQNIVAGTYTSEVEIEYNVS